MFSRPQRLGRAPEWAGSRWIQSQLFGVTANDVPTYVVSGGLLVLTALGACVIPARRAAAVNPIEALRSE